MQWRMQQQEGPPEEFIISTGRPESLRRFIELAAIELGCTAAGDGEPTSQWRGEDIKEIGRRADTGAVVVSINLRYSRPAEVEKLLAGLPAPAAKIWRPR